jgi:predicted Rossmann fold flavoprotein
MMCAATAGQRGRRVLLLDHYAEVGEKIRISGGGRCNFTNLHATHRDYLSANPDFCRSALARYTPQDFVAMVDRHGIAWHEKKLGQLFCDGSSRQVIEMLRTECARGNVEWWQPCAVAEVSRGADGFRLATARGVVLSTALVVATGGLTVPKIGATPFAYRLAEQFGHAIVPPKPALVPLSLGPELLARYGQLGGVSIDVEARCGAGRFRENALFTHRARCGAGRFRENALFTHRGLSGPSILQVSSYWQQAGGREPIGLDLLPGLEVIQWISGNRRSRSTLAALLAEHLPRRFAEQWCPERAFERPLAELSDAELARVAAELEDWRVQPSGTLGYNKAEVTLGGVDTRGLSSRTMESTTVAGLFFIGEAVDVTGHLGGFNFQWAWASAHAAGTALAGA